MKITSAIPILTFVGFLNFECAAAQDFAVVQMSDKYLFRGYLHSDRPIPDWMEPRTNPENFQGYEIFIHLWDHPRPSRRSDFLTSYTPVPLHRDAAAHPPLGTKVLLGYDYYVNKEPFELYNSTIQHVWNCDRFFITIPGTTRIYQTVLEIKEKLTAPPFFIRGPAEERRSLTTQGFSIPQIPPPANLSSSSSSNRPRA